MPDRPPEVIRDRAIRLFTFLRELTELRTKTIRSWEQYEQVVWFRDIPREAGCHCIAWPEVDREEHGDAWIEVRKPKLKAPPKPPASASPWVDSTQLSDSTRERPELRPEIVVEPEDSAEDRGTQILRLAEQPEILTAWEAYLAEQWTPWAADDQRLQRIHAVYTSLFTMYQRQQRLGEAYEVVVGLGYLTRSGRDRDPVKRHLITARSSITFDSKRGVITVGPAGEGARPTIEQDMLDPDERPDAVEQRAIEQQIAAVGEALWDHTQIPNALQSWVNAVATDGRFEDTLESQPGVTSAPTVHMAPAVILRKRTEQSFLRVFDEIIAQLRAGQEVPLGVRRVVDIVDDRPSAGLTPSETPDSAPDLEDIYFPLLANDEQLDIARKLTERQGVLVQGPPGTGKSHTIANLVCHLLATGQRVLITSHTSRALKALLDRFRSDVFLTDIADLCVILLGDDLESIEALEDSVRGITRRYKEWNPQKQERLIADRDRSLDEARRTEAVTLAKLRALREAETYQHTMGYGEYQGTAQAIAVRVRGEASEFGWLPKTEVTESEPPLSDAEALELLGALRSIGSDRERELRTSWPAPGQRLTPEAFVELLVAERHARDAFDQAGDQRAYPGYPALVPTPRELRTALVNAVEDLRGSLETLHARGERWVGEAARQVVSGRGRAWAELASETHELLSQVADKVRGASGRRVLGLEGRALGLVRNHAMVLLTHLKTKGRMGLGLLLQKAVREARYLTTTVLVDGAHCDRLLPLRHLVEWIEGVEGLARLRELWSRYVEAPGGSLAEQVAAYEDLEDALRQVLELEKKASTAKQRLVVIPGLAEPVWYEPGQLRALEDAARAVALEETLRHLKACFAAEETALRIAMTAPTAHPVAEQLLRAVSARDERGYGEARATLTALDRDKALLERRGDLLARLRQAAPTMAATLQADAEDSAWDVRLARFSGAWNWARADGWLRRQGDGSAIEGISREAEVQGQRVRTLVRDLAAAKAWKQCFAPERFTEGIRQHLEAWTKAVARIGKGTGKYAALHRRAAREHMQECRSAIPAWIMPLYRVAETVRPGVDMYDVVIVDEASQSGPEALFLHYLAKKMVIVGDDKQISPDFVGLDRHHVDLLRQRHLTDIPHNDALGVDNSFFDQAEIRFGGRIRLREHFRCMPEIIQFSNNLCYRSEPLIPLRQYGSSRVPPVVVRPVPDGYEKGHAPKVINRPEAEAIVAQIEACLADLTYADKSIGVISLLGEGQAREIERLLLDRIGPEEIEKRQLVCGDAYAFQGTERDVMFLSMVVAPRPGGRMATLSSQRDERRFNVAASRARDQLWLFHTVTLNDLNPQCLRYRLLQYCQNPHVELDPALGVRLEDLAGAARGPRTKWNVPAPFESWFEVDVFLELARHGYRVLPQYPLAGYFIDLLVEGMRGRLAVECDGDTWHGPDRYDHDMARQRMLERCGLRFWRIRGSTFYRDPAEGMAELWELLARAGIYPAGSEPPPRPATHDNRPDGDRHLLTTTLPGSGEASRDDSVANAADEDLEDGPGAPEEIDTDDGQLEIPSAALGTGPSRVPAGVRPFVRWHPRSVPDPHTARIDEIMGPLVEIVETEGPLFCYAAYRAYVKAAGHQRVGRDMRASLNRTMAAAVRRGLLVTANELNTRDQINQVVRKAGTSPVRLRTRGPRTFHDLPPSEVLALIQHLKAESPSLEGEELLAKVLQVWDIGRTTSQIRERFAEILRRGSALG